MTRLRAPDFSRSPSKTRALQRYRDRLSQSERALADLTAEESWPHAAWRKVTPRKTFALIAPEALAPIVNGWRAPTRVSGMLDEAPVYDPTSLTIDDLIKDVRERPLDGQPPAVATP